MDDQSFDAAVRRLTAAPSRRRALAALAGGILGLRGLAASEAKHKKKHKNRKPSPPPARCPASCPDCQQCVNGQSCTPKTNGTACGNNDCKTCQNGTCGNKADNTACNDGTGLCGSGTCNTPPVCLPVGSQCTPGGPGPTCCGAGQDGCRLTNPPPINLNQCIIPGPAGAPCLAVTDCLSGQCAGFRCT